MVEYQVQLVMRTIFGFWDGRARIRRGGRGDFHKRGRRFCFGQGSLDGRRRLLEQLHLWGWQRAGRAGSRYVRAGAQNERNRKQEE